jgi:predicted nuclease of predicted toxin-antitoxin system
MRLLLNENMPGSLTGLLRAAGHDVLAVKDAMRGADDGTVLARSRSEARLLLTQDKDFGELAFRYGLPAECGIILFRLTGADPEATTRRMLDVLAARGDWAGNLAVITDDRVRMRPLPPRKE